ncbi:unnamed protein product [Nesidiocoris tenuis]|uniref:Uncharacterized protein n=1 Tax=Nesidiocoris tenuis TaxID=355587 RepID=A0A6H5GEC8_9HEMI|nr:unnamed protein product [Nesidiocoris tenuis]
MRAILGAIPDNISIFRVTIYYEYAVSSNCKSTIRPHSSNCDKCCPGCALLPSRTRYQLVRTYCYSCAERSIGRSTFLCCLVYDMLTPIQITHRSTRRHACVSRSASTDATVVPPSDWPSDGGVTRPDGTIRACALVNFERITIFELYEPDTEERIP